MPSSLTPSDISISADEFASLLGDFAPYSSKMAIAVSGGPDSMALAFCARRWGLCDILALIVDHGLRPSSADEAALVKSRLEEMGIPSEILHWQHEPLTSGLHEKARQARYHLLLDACRRHGTRDLLLAHHRDDQAETILMRFAKGSGIEGLAGMTSQSRRGETRILRPFLSLPKARLIATCQKAGISFVCDPSNEKSLFARGRLRKIMPLLANEGLSIDNIVQLGARAAEAKDALETYTQMFLRSSAQSEIGGSIRIERAELRDLPRAIALRALGVCLRYVHLDDYPPEYVPLSELLDTILTAKADTSRTFYGCMASIAENKVTLFREPAAASEILPLHAGETILWDKRWLVTADKASPSAVIQALECPTHEEIDQLAPGLRHLIPQGRIRASLPAIWVEGQRRAIPSFDKKGLFHLTYRKQAFP